MKISELAHYRELLESLRPSTVDRAIRAEMDNLIDTIRRHPSQMPTRLQDMQTARNTALSATVQFDQALDQMLSDLLEQIKALEPRYLAQSYQWYEVAQERDTVDYVLNRRFGITTETRDYIQSRVMAHSDYHYPGMVIRPGLEDWVENMVACDPLYLVDTNHDLFEPVKQRFNEIYQNRLRYYAIRESSEEPMMEALPNDQFGFCLAYNFFHYKPFEIMRAYLREIYQKLRPGGVLAMTYNDCDRKGAVELAERSFTCYTPGRMILAICESVGFVLEQNYRVDAAVNWVELRRPGQMTSLRGGQSLAKIIAKSK
jgi:SAM-dependent methyltransferase